MSKKQHIHFIGICGVAMSALARAFQKNGWTVTGSDKGFFPPVSTELEQAGISFYPGWHPEKMMANSAPDLVVVGNVASSENSEWLEAKKHHIPCFSYPEIVAKELIRPQSIVCAGTYGKTTTSALLAWILQTAGMKENHLTGGIPLNDFPPAVIQEGAVWSVVEGDEYISARWDTRPKFAHYRPTHLLLTAIVWDHADVYTTVESYEDAFVSLTQELPKNGLLVVSKRMKDIDTLKKNTRARLVDYGREDALYTYSEVQETKTGVLFTIQHKKKTYSISSRLLSGYMAENMTGCFALAHEIGIPTEKIIEALQTFKGLKRRTELRLDGPIKVIDDIAHSPAKAKSILESVSRLNTGKIYAIFEPNTGNRKKEAAPQYAYAFTDAFQVIVPRLTSVKIAKDDPSPPQNGEVVAGFIAETHPNVLTIENDKALVSHLLSQTKPGDMIVFLGSHGFRGMIEETTQKLQENYL